MAESYFLRAIAMGNAVAPANLLSLLVAQDRDDEVRTWLDRLPELDALLGYMVAAVAFLDKDDEFRARQVLMEGAGHGFGPAIELLAARFAEHDEPDEAEHWARIGYERSRDVTGAEAEQWARLCDAPPGAGSARILSCIALDRGDLAAGKAWAQLMPAEYRAAFLATLPPRAMGSEPYSGSISP